MNYGGSLVGGQDRKGWGYPINEWGGGSTLGEITGKREAESKGDHQAFGKICWGG